MNHGASSATVKGEKDLAGEPRILGKGPDMGAYERVQHPTAGHLLVTKRGKHSLMLSALVNAEGSSTVVQGVAGRKDFSIVMAPKPAGSSRKARVVHVVIAHLSRHTAYRVHVVASNAGGAVTRRGARPSRPSDRPVRPGSRSSQR